MTIIRAKNPQHTRAFDTSKLWWLDDAWDGRTSDWFASDGSGHRLDELLQALLGLHTVNVPGLLPSSDWLIDLFQKHSHTRVNDFDGFGTRGLSRHFSWMRESGEEIRWKGGPETKTHQLAQYALCRTADFTAIDWHEAELHTGQPIINLITSNIDADAQPLARELPFLAVNPNLPALDFEANRQTKLTPYRWWAHEIVRRQSGYQDSRMSKARELLTFLLMNEGASHEDLMYVLEQVSRVAEGKHLEHFTVRASLHPNWEGEDKLTLGVRHPKGLVAPTYRSSIDTSLKSVKSILLGEALNYGTSDVIEAAFEMLLRGNQGNVMEFLRSRVVGASEEEPIPGQASFRRSLRVHSANKTVAYLAPALGFLFKEQVETLGGEDVPFEWLLELL